MPRRLGDHTLELPGGRRLAYCVSGDPDGSPILNCHGGLVSGHDVLPAADAARSLGLCLVSPDRPGIGRSDPVPALTLLDWARTDASALLDHIGVERCSVMGWSEGGQYALACGVALADRIDRVAVIAGCVPLDDPAAFARLNGLDRRLVRSASRTTLLLRAYFLATRLTARVAPRLVVRAATRDLPAAEAAAVVAEGRWLADALGEGAASGRGGVAEYRAICAPWGFGPEDVTVPVTVYQGDADQLVPPEWAEALVGQLPDAELVTYPGEGHFIGLTRRRDVLVRLAHGDPTDGDPTDGDPTKDPAGGSDGRTAGDG